MPCDVLVGTQWGDEGKAKIIDYLSDNADIVARFQGGANAGHTVYYKGEKFVFHLIPSGILHPEKTCLIGSGVVVDPFALFGEIDLLKERGISTKGRIKICGTAHLIMPYHRILDASLEGARGEDKIGTTGKGIGPAYTFKAARRGIRFYDIINGNFEEKIHHHVDEVNFLLANLYRKSNYKDKFSEYIVNGKIDAETIIAQCHEYKEQLQELVLDGALYVGEALENGKTVLAEGAQGTGLDINFGTYPYVTSSNPTAGGACTGIGVGPRDIRHVYGIIKAYTTRVGEGPFPTELEDEDGETLRRVGGEFGATTGRPRRCGWLDGVFGRYACRINGISELILTKLDVLDDFDEIKVCTGYNLDGDSSANFCADAETLDRAQPEYTTLPGWKCNTSEIRSYEKLPREARDYIDFLENFLKTPIRTISVGPEREQTIPR